MIWAVGQGTQSHFLHVGRWLLISPSPTRQPLTPMKRGFSVPNDHMAGGGDVCGGWEGGSVEASEEGSLRGSGWEGVTSLYIKLEKFIIYHYIQPEMPPNFASPPTKNITPSGKRGGGERKNLKKKQKKNTVRAPAAADGQN